MRGREGRIRGGCVCIADARSGKRAETINGRNDTVIPEQRPFRLTSRAQGVHRECSVTFCHSQLAPSFSPRPEVDHSCRSRIIACRKMADRFRQSTVAFCQEKENSFSMMNEC